MPIHRLKEANHTHNKQADLSLKLEMDLLERTIFPSPGRQLLPSLLRRQELAGNEPTLSSPGPARELLMPRADVHLPGLHVQRPGTTHSLQLANLRDPGAILDPQLGTGPRPVCPGWGLCLLLLGFKQAQGYPLLPPELCLHPHTPVSQRQEAGNHEPGNPGVLGLPLTT